MKARLSSKSIGLYCKTHWIGTKRTYPSRLTYLMRAIYSFAMANGHNNTRNGKNW